MHIRVFVVLAPVGSVIIKLSTRIIMAAMPGRSKHTNQYGDGLFSAGRSQHTNQDANGLFSARQIKGAVGKSNAQEANTNLKKEIEARTHFNKISNGSITKQTREFSANSFLQSD